MKFVCRYSSEDLSVHMAVASPACLDIVSVIPNMLVCATYSMKFCNRPCVAFTQRTSTNACSQTYTFAVQWITFWGTYSFFWFCFKAMFEIIVCKKSPSPAVAQK